MPLESLELRLLRYFERHKQVPSAQLYSWVRSYTRGSGYTRDQFDDALRKLRDDGVIACTAGVWWLRSYVHQRRPVIHMAMLKV